MPAFPLRQWAKELKQHTLVAYFAAPPLAPVIEDLMVGDRFGPAAQHMLALVLAFVFVLVVWSLASRLVKALIHATPLSVLDRLGGAGFGALRGVFIALLLVLVVGASPLAESPTWQASRAAPVLAGKPVVLATVRGGSYAAGTPREGWDHSTPYLRRILADVWGADLTLVEREFTLVGVNPALDQFKDMADAMRVEALCAAEVEGRKRAESGARKAA